MASTQQKRSQMRHFLNTAPSAGTPTWSWINTGHAALTTSYNAETDTQQWIGEDSGSTFVMGYAPTIDTEQVAYAGDPVFDFVDNLSWTLAKGAAAETDYVEVRLYKGTGPQYPARRFRVSISIESEGDAATDPLSRSYTINFIGDPTFGTFNPQTSSFIATP